VAYIRSSVGEGSGCPRAGEVQLVLEKIRVWEVNRVGEGLC
jgi:hypothetical protein